MIRIMLWALVAPLAVAATLCSTPYAEAADRFGVIGIENSTDVTIRLEHRWGNGPWNLDVLGPGHRKWYWHTYAFANEDKSPPFHVRFDSDLSPGRFMERYALTLYRAPAHEWSNAHKYIFRYEAGRRFIELYDEKK